MARRSENKTDPETETAADRDKDAGKLGYRVFASLGAVIGTSLARRALTIGWKKATGKEPPDNPAHPDVRWGEATSWVVASAAVMAAAKLMAQRRVAATWQRASGTLPPGLDRPDE